MIQTSHFQYGILKYFYFQELSSVILGKNFPGRNGKVWEKMQSKDFFYSENISGSAH